jgi:hAT family C-terminal dimerisation region
VEEQVPYYLIPARLAMVYLAVQATSAPSERIFSMASRIITNRRNRLDPTMAGKMLILSENWKWRQDQLDFHKATEDEEVEVREE